MTMVRVLRQQHNLDPTKLAATLGITLPAYYDLEDHTDEIQSVASIQTVVRLAREFHVRPSALYGASSRETLSLEELVASVRKHLDENGKQLQQFEDEVGWELASALRDHQVFLDFSADGLRDVCNPLGIDWFSVLDGVNVD